MVARTLDLGSHYFEADGIKFHYNVVGRGPVIIVQSVGWGMAGNYLWNGLQKLSISHTVVYFEPRGNGLSSRPTDDNTMCSKFMIDDLDHLRKELGFEKLPVLLGHSNGGCIVLGYAEKYPNRVHKLILVCSQIHNPPLSESFKQWIADREKDPKYAISLPELDQSPGKLPQTVEAFQERFRKILPWYMADANFDLAPVAANHMEDGEVPPSLYAYNLWWKLEFQAENQVPHIADAKRVQAKTLIIWGNDDTVSNIVSGNAIAKAIPGARFVVLANCGHFPWIETPDEFWAAINTFLREYSDSY